jgi:ectoine hydroxylase-related dioxygenase (phytanoyl-CoA dioxygenase family)
MKVVTLWLAADEVDRENGCMRVIPGSQRHQLEGIRDRKDVVNVLGAEIDVDPSSIDESLAVDIELHPGDVEVHHPNIIHGSHANTSDRWRRGLTIRYIPTSTRITDADPGRPYDSAFHLRGNPGSANEYQPQPVYDPARHYAFRDYAAWV